MTLWNIASWHMMPWNMTSWHDIASYEIWNHDIWHHGILFIMTYDIMTYDIVTYDIVTYYIINIRGQGICRHDIWRHDKLSHDILGHDILMHSCAHKSQSITIFLFHAFSGFWGSKKATIFVENWPFLCIYNNFPTFFSIFTTMENYLFFIRGSVQGTKTVAFWGIFVSALMPEP